MAEPDGGQSVAFYGTASDHWSHTQIRDWVMLHPDMNRTAFLLYSLLRSMVSEKRPGSLRRMSLDQLCWLMPGINGKPTGVSTITDALRVLSRLGLVTNPDGERLVTSTGRGGIQNCFRRYQVHDLPPQGYRGWRNAWDALDAYRPDWRQNPPEPPTADPSDGGLDSRKSGIRTDQQRSDETPAGIDSRISAQPRRNSGTARRNSDGPRLLTSSDALPKEVSQRRSSLSAAKPADHRAGSLGVANPAEPTSPSPIDAGSREDLDAVAEQIATAWAAGLCAGGGTQMPRRRAQIRVQAGEILTAGEQDLEFLLARAHWMGEVKPTWGRFEDALTYQGEGAPARRAAQTRPARTSRCGTCDNGWRYRDPENALGPYRCPDCSALAKGQASGF